ncbi:uncharacterized protein V6R79_004349 [Siganus canaliculatus]
MTGKLLTDVIQRVFTLRSRAEAGGGGSVLTSTPGRRTRPRSRQLRDIEATATPRQTGGDGRLFVFCSQAAASGPPTTVIAPTAAAVLDGRHGTESKVSNTSKPAKPVMAPRSRFQGSSRATGRRSRSPGEAPSRPICQSVPSSPAVDGRPGGEGRGGGRLPSLPA